MDIVLDPASDWVTTEMPVSNGRAAAFDILLRVERQQSFAGELLHSERISKLIPEDRGLCTELVLGSLRWQSALDRRIAEASERSIGKFDLEVLIALRLGAYQLQFLERVPARAAVNESVELVKRARKRSAVGLANAVLRKLTQQSAAAPDFVSLDTPASIAAALSHPEWLVSRWMENYDLQAALTICRYDQHAPATVLRLPFDPELRKPLEAELEAAAVVLSPGSLVSCARLVQSGSVQHTKAFQEGRVWIQDEASQLIAMLVGNGRRILDCCAAPGGKTAALAERNPKSRIVAAELHPHRARLLQHRVTASNVEVVNADVACLPASPAYDRILADVPCSGTGTLARNPEIRWRLRPENLAELQRRQIDILCAGLSRLEPGGRIVYSTCSLEPEEGEQVIAAALTSCPGSRVIDCASELHNLRSKGELAFTDIDQLCRGPYMRTIPGLHPCDGFFAAIIERVSE